MVGPEIERLIQLLAKLPGMGPRSARRAALHMLKRRDTVMTPLAAALTETAEKIRPCTTCGNLSTQDPCAICTDPRRDAGLLCVVEEPTNLLALERTRAYRGLYHVLGGALSPLRDVGPDELRVKELLERVEREAPKEVILATSPNVEGEATAVYLAKLLKPTGVGLSRLAQGLPAGADFDFTDDLTLQRALEGRRDY